MTKFVAPRCLLMLRADVSLAHQTNSESGEWFNARLQLSSRPASSQTTLQQKQPRELERDTQSVELCALGSLAACSSHTAAVLTWFHRAQGCGSFLSWILTENSSAGERWEEGRGNPCLKRRGEDKSTRSQQHDIRKKKKNTRSRWSLHRTNKISLPALQACCLRRAFVLHMHVAQREELIGGRPRHPVREEREVARLRQSRRRCCGGTMLECPGSSSSEESASLAADPAEGSARAAARDIISSKRKHSDTDGKAELGNKWAPGEHGQD